VEELKKELYVDDNEEIRKLALRFLGVTGLRVLYMPGYANNAIVHHGFLEKGVNYIQKPFTLEILARKVREGLDKI